MSSAPPIKTSNARWDAPNWMVSFYLPRIVFE